MLNRAILIGRLGRNPETRVTQGGNSVCTFTLATDTGIGDKRRTDWHSIAAFGKIADVCAQHLAKGALVYIDGRISYDEYMKDGQKRTKTSIIVNDIRFLSTKSEYGNPQPDDAQSKHTPPKNDDTFSGDAPCDDIPF